MAGEFRMINVNEAPPRPKVIQVNKKALEFDAIMKEAIANFNETQMGVYEITDETTTRAVKASLARAAKRANYDCDSWTSGVEGDNKVYFIINPEPSKPKKS